MLATRVLLLMLGAQLVSASLLSRPPLAAGLRLRGGLDALDDDDEKPADSEGNPGSSPGLTDEQILEKLNGIPTFVVMGQEGGFVALTLREGGRAICFFVEPEEAKAVLNMTQASNTEVPLKLACVGLGNAMKCVS
jgi:hypothetical protein